ncbi:MAG TPA: hypothetical protein VFJ74_13290 [Gemmatimonadaceae bacterium]|nr:hypothetical protein [Gemmatimonadaceae bacterium]
MTEARVATRRAALVGGGLLLLGLAFWGGLAADGGPSAGMTPNASATGGATIDAALGEAVATIRVRAASNGEVVRFAPPRGEPAVLMVSSVTCEYCDRALRDAARFAGGRPLPGLRVVTLEGVAGGKEMLERTGVRGAWLAEPAGNADRVLLTFRVPGTPVFAVVDSGGRVTSVVPGYAGRDAIEALMGIMLGAGTSR